MVDHLQDCFEDTVDSGDERARLLESYILDKKRTHLSILDYQATLWQQQKKEAEERKEEQLVEVELVDSGRSQSLMAQRANLMMLDDTPSHDINKDDGDAHLVASAAPCLELEASALLQLLPPLERCSSKHSAKGKGREKSDQSRRCPIPSYYPYLAPLAPELVTDGGTPAACAAHPDQEEGVNCVPANVSSDRHSLQPKRMIAFHTAGYGLGWMDFEACGDWLVVQKNGRQH